MSVPTTPEPRDAPPRDLRERFISASVAEYRDGPAVTAARAWDLIIDTWRVIEVADARAGAGAPVAAEREVWMAALRVAIYRAEGR